MIGCEDRLRNDLYCVEWGVKLYSNQLQPTLLPSPKSNEEATGAQTNVQLERHKFESELHTSCAELRVGTNRGTIGGGMGQGLGGHHGECGARAHNGCLGQSPQRGPGAEPLVRESGGEAALKLKALWSLDVQRSRQI